MKKSCVEVKTNSMLNQHISKNVGNRSRGVKYRGKVCVQLNSAVE